MARAINLLIDVRNLTDEKQPARHGPGRTSPARRVPPTGARCLGWAAIPLSCRLAR